MADIVEVLHKTNQYVFFLASFGGKLAEFGSCWIPETKTLRVELSSMYGCVMNCSHCEYSYRYEDDVTQSELGEQFVLIKTACERHFEQADRIVISFCRMGEPTLNPEVMKFVREIWQHFRHKRKKIVFEIPTVLPEDGAKFMLDAKKFSAVEGARVRPVVTLHSTDERHRKGVTGLEMIEAEKLDGLLSGWKARPIVFLQPVEVGQLTSFEVCKLFDAEKVDLIWNHMETTIPITLLGHKVVTMRQNYDQHIRYVTRGFAAKDVTIEKYDKNYHGVSYSSSLTPGQMFSLAMKENLVRKIAELKAVK